MVADDSGVFTSSSSVMPHCAQNDLCVLTSSTTFMIVRVAAWIAENVDDFAARRLYERRYLCFLVIESIKLTRMHERNILDTGSPVWIRVYTASVRYQFKDTDLMKWIKHGRGNVPFASCTTKSC